MTMENSITSSANTLSQTLKIKSRLRQGDPLTSTLFNVALKEAICNKTSNNVELSAGHYFKEMIMMITLQRYVPIRKLGILSENQNWHHH